MIFSNTRNERGFVALIALTLISFILLISTITLSQLSILGRFSLLDTEFKEKSLRIVEGCFTLMQVALYNNPHYLVVDKKISYDTESCTFSIRHNGINESEIQITTDVHDSVTTLRALFDTTTQEYFLVEEIPNYSSTSTP